MSHCTIINPMHYVIFMLISIAVFSGTAVIYRCEYISYFENIDKDGLGPTKSILCKYKLSTDMLHKEYAYFT